MKLAEHGQEVEREQTGGALDPSLPAYLVVDRRQHIARARGRLHPTDRPPRRAGWLDPPVSLGELLGCINIVVEKRPCGHTSRCHYCTLQHALSRATAWSETNIGACLADGDEIIEERPRPETVVFERTCLVAGRPVTRRLHVSVRPTHARHGRHGRRRVLVALRDAPPRDS
ncbi:MAG: hypothetical protein ACYTG2_01635 [Planctomycetota bacterium]|jgi:hypothetical protein